MILGALALLFVGAASARALGWVAIDADMVRGWVGAAGPWGLVVYVGLFAVGAVLNVPGLVFVAAAVAAWGPRLGFFAALLGALVAVHVTFLLPRLLGGSGGARVEHRWLNRLRGLLQRRPVVALVALRALVLVSPPVNALLGLSDMKLRHYAIGSAIGLLLPLLVVTQGLGCWLS